MGAAITAAIDKPPCTRHAYELEIFKAFATLQAAVLSDVRQVSQEPLAVPPDKTFTAAVGMIHGVHYGSPDMGASARPPGTSGCRTSPRTPTTSWARPGASASRNL